MFPPFLCFFGENNFFNILSVGRGVCSYFLQFFWVSHANDTFHHICALTSISLKFPSRIRDLAKVLEFFKHHPLPVLLDIKTNYLHKLFDKETNQSCANEDLHKPILSSGDGEIYIGYDCINNFCEDVFAGIDQTEWFIAHFGSGFDSLSIFEWLYKQHNIFPIFCWEVMKLFRCGLEKTVQWLLSVHSDTFIKVPTIFNLKEVKKVTFLVFGHLNILFIPLLLHSCIFNKHARREKTAVCDELFPATALTANCFSANSGQAQGQDFALKEGQFPPACLLPWSRWKAWYAAQTEFYWIHFFTYDFEQELVSYCQSDGELLKEGFMEFRNLRNRLCNCIDFFDVAWTAASACN